MHKSPSIDQQTRTIKQTRTIGIHTRLSRTHPPLLATGTVFNRHLSRWEHENDNFNSEFS